jgi:hypothetical protein
VVACKSGGGAAGTVRMAVRMRGCRGCVCAVRMASVRSSGSKTGLDSGARGNERDAGWGVVTRDGGGRWEDG